MTSPGLSHYGFPPYGHMIKEWEDDTGTPQAPDEWKGRMKYEAWIDAMARLFGDILWPRFDEASRSWTGKAVPMMEDLTELDFTLFSDLRKKIHDPFPGVGQFPTHYEVFQMEDEADAKQAGSPTIDRGPDKSLRLIQAALLAPAQVEALVTAHMTGVRRGANNVDLDLKVRMQRPRAYQMAWIMEKDFSHQMAKSALTPSMISGHCFETLTGGAHAYRLASAEHYSDDAIDALARWTVEVGDRRVYAGVHYPSDNISSWITALLLAPEIGIAESEVAWLWEIVQARSLVYRAVDDADSAGGATSPYRPSLALLKAIGRRDVRTVSDVLAPAV